MDELAATIPPANYSSTEPTVSEFTDYLDFEIRRVEDNQQRSGWTHRALIAATAGVLWTLLGYWPPVGNSGHHIFMSFFAGLFLVDSCMSIYSGLTRPLRPVYPIRWRYRFAYEMYWDSRITFLWAIIRSFLVLYWMGEYISYLPLALSWPARIYLGVVGALAVLGFLVTYSAVPVPTTSVYSPLVLRIFLMVIGLCSPWVAILAVAEIVTSASVYSATELRYGSLLAILVHLFLILTWKQRDRGLLGTLIELRREVSLRQVEPRDAHRQAILAIKGMYAIDVMQRPLREMLGYLHEASRRQVAVERLVEQLRASQDYGNRHQASIVPKREAMQQQIDDTVRAGRVALQACDVPLVRLKYYERILEIFEPRTLEKLHYISEDILIERDRIFDNQRKIEAEVESCRVMELPKEES